ncbi:MAG: hypothetical protein ACI9C1_003292, partial [Candidatus Aldehydirespiratoraceae bacterium]
MKKLAALFSWPEPPAMSAVDSLDNFWTPVTG